MDREKGLPIQVSHINLRGWGLLSTEFSRSTNVCVGMQIMNSVRTKSMFIRERQDHFGQQKTNQLAMRVLQKSSWEGKETKKVKMGSGDEVREAPEWDRRKKRIGNCGKER